MIYPKQLTIIGHGNVGGALIQNLVEANYHVHIGARNLEDAKLDPWKKKNKVSIHSIQESISQSTIIIIAIPAHLTAELARSLGDLSDKIIIDTTNSLFKKPEPFHTAFEAFKELTGAKLAKCFNCTSAENMRNPLYHLSTPIPHELPLDMFIAGTDKEAKQCAMELAKDIGFIPYDFGGDDKVGLLEEFCRIWINMSSQLGREFGFKILRR